MNSTDDYVKILHEMYKIKEANIKKMTAPPPKPKDIYDQISDLDEESQVICSRLSDGVGDDGIRGMGDHLKAFLENRLVEICKERLAILTREKIG